MADAQIKLKMKSFNDTTKECLGVKLACNKHEEVGNPYISEYFPIAETRINFPNLNEEFKPKSSNKFDSVSTMLSC